eukprot:9490323-Pyramimonas_sp.AAC.1
MPNRWAQTERSAASEGGAGSGLLSYGYGQRYGRARFGWLSSRGGGSTGGGHVAANPGVRRRVCGGSARGAHLRSAGGMQGCGAAGAGGAWRGQRLAQAAG